MTRKIRTTNEAQDRFKTLSPEDQARLRAESLARRAAQFAETNKKTTATCDRKEAVRLRREEAYRHVANYLVSVICPEAMHEDAVQADIPFDPGALTIAEARQYGENVFERLRSGNRDHIEYPAYGASLSYCLRASVGIGRQDQVIGALASCLNRISVGISAENDVLLPYARIREGQGERTLDLRSIPVRLPSGVLSPPAPVIK